MQTFRVPTLPWYDDVELELDFPDSWQVVLCSMKGNNLPTIGDQEICQAFAKPLGSKLIRELASICKEIVILFDDLSRPTKIQKLIQPLLHELETAGISDERIRFVAALGAHGSHTREDFVKKLGSDIVERYCVYNHNPYENCIEVGRTSRGTPVFINAEVMSCDLKIGIGVVTPHRLTGFGGGSKIIVPGVASIETIIANHFDLAGRGPGRNLHPSLGLGMSQNNIMLLDIEEAGRTAGLDIKIDAVMSHGRLVGLFVGDPVTEHAEAVRFARQVYITEPERDADIVVANVYSKDNEAAIAAWLDVGTKKKGASLVVIANTPAGQVVHYLVRSFGKNIGGRLWTPQYTLPNNIDHLIVFAPYFDKASCDWFGPPALTHWAKTWQEVIDILREIHGDNPKVAIYPDRLSQYFPN